MRPSRLLPAATPPARCLGSHLLVGLLLAAILVACGGAPALVGTALDGDPAPAFALTDFRGAPLALGDLRGKAVALTFIYTTCPDICPLTAETFRAAWEALPPETRDKVALVAITVDPERDTAAALRAFSATHGLADNPDWYALRGDRATLEPIWSAYGIDPGSTPATIFSPETQLPHSDAVFLIDPAGRERAFTRSDVDPAALAASLRTLAQ